MRAIVQPRPAVARLLLLAAALLAAGPSAVQGSPAYPVERVFIQPDGSTVRLHLWGDEFANGWRTGDGHTVVLDRRSASWAYAVRASDGGLVPSGIAVGRGSPPAPAGLRPAPAVVAGTALAAASPTFAPAGPLAAPAWAGPDTDLLLITVDFADLGCTFSDTDFQGRLFGGGASGPGDLDDYFREVSRGNLELDGLVEGGSGCYRLANTHDHYDEGPGSAPALVREAVLLADADVDFSRFDNDGDGYVDAVGVIYAGGGAHDGCERDPGGSNRLWPHSWNLNSGGVGEVAVDGVKVNHYIIQSEITWAVADAICDEPQTIGLFAHELGHALGLPDLYDTDGSSEGVGSWSAMASQFLSSVVLADTPPHYDPWSKWVLGWITPSDRTGYSGYGPIEEVEDAGFVIRILGNPGGPERGGTGEYFLLENRQRVGFDSRLPGCGLLAWHVDESKTTNRFEGHAPSLHRLVDLEEADGLDELDAIQVPRDRGDPGDPYPGTAGNRTFDGPSHPSSNLYSGAPSGVAVTDVSDCGPVMYAAFSRPAADLELAKSGAPDPAVAGTGLVWTLGITNHGPSPAENVVVADRVPAGVGIVSVSAPGGSCDAGVPGDPARPATCTFDAIAAGMSPMMTVTAVVLPDTVGVLRNDASLAGATPDPNDANNAATATTTVVAAADLALEKDGALETGNPAGDVVYTLTIANRGPSDARDVTLVDDLPLTPKKLRYLLDTGDGACSYARATHRVTCGFGTVPAGATRSVRVHVNVVGSVRAITNAASVSSSTPDPAPENNTASKDLLVKGGTQR